MNRTLRRRLDGVLDRRVAGAAEALAEARARRDAAGDAAAEATARVDTEAHARLADLRRPPPGPLPGRGEAVARGRARILALDQAAAGSRRTAQVAGGACAEARQVLLRALVRRRALARALDGLAEGPG